MAFGSNGVFSKTELIIVAVALLFMGVGIVVRKVKKVNPVKTNNLINDFLRGVTICAVMIILYAMFTDKQHFVDMLINGKNNMTFLLACLTTLVILGSDYLKFSGNDDGSK